MPLANKPKNKQNGENFGAKNLFARALSKKVQEKTKSLEKVQEKTKSLEQLFGTPQKL